MKKTRYEKARAALLALTDAERRQIFREVGSCGCITLTRSMVANPGAAVGGLVGALLGAAFSRPKPREQQGTIPVYLTKQSTLLASVHVCDSCCRGYHRGNDHDERCTCRGLQHEQGF